MALTLLDIAVIVIILVSTILAFMRGFVHETLGIAAWVGAVLFTLYGFPVTHPLAARYISPSWAADAITAIVLFLAALIILSIITSSLSRRVQQSRLSALDRSLGVLFGLFRGAVIVSLAFIVLTWIFPAGSTQPSWIAGSASGPWLQTGADMARSVIPSRFLDDEKRLQSGTHSTTQSVQKVLEAGKTLKNPSPSTTSESTEVKNSAPTPDRDTATEKGYDEKQRQALDRLFESAQ